MRSTVRVLLAVALAALFLAGMILASEAVNTWALLYLGAPVGLAVALVIARRYSPLQAAGSGALISIGIAATFVLPGFIVKWASGDWASGPDCDGFCMSNDGGFIFALFIFGVIAVPLGIAGGLISAVASLTTVRPAENQGSG